MSFFVQSARATPAKTKNIQPVSLGLAGVLILMVVAQLFKYEAFPNVIVDMGIADNEVVASIYTALIVALEVTALPFLLRMRLSPAMRVVSMVSGWIVIAFWIAVSIVVNIWDDVNRTGGLLGDTIAVPVGWWNVLFCLGLGVLAAWAAWGMWPFDVKQKK